MEPNGPLRRSGAMASLERHYISTGHLPAPKMLQSLVQDMHRRSKLDGKNSQAYGANATGLPFNSLAKIAANPLLPKEIQAQVDLGNITCVSNDQLRNVI